MSAFKIEKVRINDKNEKIGEMGNLKLGPRERDWIKSWSKSKNIALTINGNEAVLNGNITQEDVEKLKASLKDYRKSSNIGYIIGA